MVSWRCLAAAVVVALCAALPAMAADEDCDPEVERALVENAEAGARDDIRIVRDREMGIRDPDSLFDLSCVTDMFNFDHSNILTPGRNMTDIVGLLNRALCDKLREALGRFSGRGFNAMAFARELPLLPGLDFEPERRNLLEEDLRRRELERQRRAREAERRRNNLGPGASQAVPRRDEAPRPRAPASRPDLFRDLLGGGGDRGQGR